MRSVRRWYGGSRRSNRLRCHSDPVTTRYGSSNTVLNGWSVPSGRFPKTRGPSPAYAAATTAKLTLGHQRNERAIEPPMASRPRRMATTRNTAAYFKELRSPHRTRVNSSVMNECSSRALVLVSMKRVSILNRSGDSMFTTNANSLSRPIAFIVGSSSTP